MSPPTVRTALAGLAVTAALATVACGRDAGGTAEPTARTAVEGEITVFAAASLTESFTQLGREFETANPRAEVVFNFAGSATLAAQINQGAPADVFAAAAPANVKAVVDAGNGAGPPTIFVRNRLVIAVPKGNANGIAGLADLAKPGVKVAICAEQVPCGAAARQALATARVRLTPVTLEPDVKAALSKVKIGEVDAALVYRTDVLAAASDVDGVELAEPATAVNEYPIIALRDAPNPDGARAFIAYALSDRAKAVLGEAGFQTP